jgi:hypothetical protein
MIASWRKPDRLPPAIRAAFHCSGTPSAQDTMKIASEKAQAAE